MKKLLLSLLFIFFTISCFANDCFTIIGKLPSNDSDNRYIYLIKKDLTKLEPTLVIDSALIENAMFTFNGKIKKPDVYCISFRDEEPTYFDTFVIIEPGIVKVNYKPLSIKGTPLNDIYTNSILNLFTEAANLEIEKDSLVSKNLVSKEREDELEKQSQTLTDKIKSNICQFVKDNSGNQIGDYFYMYMKDFLGEENTNELSLLISNDLKEKLVIRRKQTSDRLAHLDSLQENAKTAIVEGGKYIDIMAFTPEGKDVSLSDYINKNKVTMIDFWASWCGPCIKELPFFKSLYEEYKGKGFEIVGISLDIRKSEWITGINKYEISWIQLSDMNNWLSPIVATYGVRSIPYTILVDQNGIIVGKNLKDNDLLLAIEKALE